MKKCSLSLSGFFIVCFFSGRSFGAVEARLIQDDPLCITTEFKVEDYDVHSVEINGELYSKITIPNSAIFLKKGYPELPKLSNSIIIPDDAHMSYRIVASEYETMVISPVIPSKGNLMRNVNPATVPYTFSEFYQRDEWFPEKTIELHNPFMIRDFRGITIQFNPFQYNPETQELKICKRIVVEVYPDGPGEINVKARALNTISKDFSDIYRALFLNFLTTRYGRYP